MKVKHHYQIIERDKLPSCVRRAISVGMRMRRAVEDAMAMDREFVEVNDVVDWLIDLNIDEMANCLSPQKAGKGKPIEKLYDREQHKNLPEKFEAS